MMQSIQADTIVTFNEVQYNPAGNDETLEFIELYNQCNVPVDIANWRIAGGVSFKFAPGAKIGGRQYLVIAADPARVEEATGVSGVLGPWSGRLNNGGESLRLRNHNDRLMDELDYNDRDLWPVAADGSGATLSKIDARNVSHREDNWTFSPQNGGTPGAANFPDPTAPPELTTSSLLKFADVWRYNETGADLGQQWAAARHPAGVGGWEEGPGVHAFESRLQVDLGTELTRPILNDPYVLTYYFEREFTLTEQDIELIKELQIRHYVDDGAVFYINGTEVHRYEMPEGEITAATESTGSGDADLLDPVGVLPPRLVVGENRISVQVHQASSGSSDVVFGMELDIVRFPPSSAGTSIGINEIASSDGADWWIEFKNFGSSPVDLKDYSISTSSDGGHDYVFPTVSIPAGGIHVVDSETLGFIPGSGERVFLYSPGKAEVIDAVLTKRRILGRLPDDKTGSFLAASTGTPGAENEFSLNDSIVINEIMYNYHPTYAQSGQAAPQERQEIFSWGKSWRYNQSGEDLGIGWQSTQHPVGGNWQEGPGPLGVDNRPPPIPAATPLMTSSINGPLITTYYFETEFDVSAELMDRLVTLVFTHEIDDGAVFYLNGQEIERFGMPSGVIEASTLAARSGDAELETFAIEPEFLIQGRNRISVEVHQRTVGSSDVYMGLKLDADVEVGEGVGDIPFEESREEWIELYNRSAEPQDLSQWEFRGGIEFSFPEDISIPAGGYLVVAKDAAALSLKWPDTTIVGDFSGSLGDRGDYIRLLDAQNNPVDEVRYFDDEPWPSFADGGGSSLELRNPHADNSVPEAWSGSDSSTDSEWKSYSFTLTAENPRYRPGIRNFHELRLGLLDAGEILVDDISVVEDPAGDNIELMQNGSMTQQDFSWRFLGSHQDSGSMSLDGNNVMKVVAVDRMTYLNNLIESTLKNGDTIHPVKNGTDYRISFRAKWLRGSPQFRAELYYNKLAKTVILEQPDRHGTPGRQNSAFVENLGPTISHLTHSPATPQPGESVTVTATASDPDGVSAMTIHYRVGNGAFVERPHDLL